MDLTIEQALQKGVAAHKEGKLKDAELLYRAILQSQPTHPDANHNLGILALSVNKVDAALQLFKTALEANPKIEKFWLSYINALIKDEKVLELLECLKKITDEKTIVNNTESLEAFISKLPQESRDQIINLISPTGIISKKRIKKL